MGRWGLATRRWRVWVAARVDRLVARLDRLASRPERPASRLPGPWTRRRRPWTPRRTSGSSPPPGLVGALVALPLLAWTVARGVAGGPAMVSGDPTYFFVSGWASAHGDVVYRHTWDVKPPGVHLASWATAAVGGSPAGYYLVVLAVVAAVTLAAFLLADALLWSLDAGTAGRAAGALAPVAYPPLYRLPMRGAYAKVFVLALALGALLALRRDRPLVAGAAAAGAAAFWQAGVLVVAAVGVAAARRGGRRAAGRFVAGGAGVAALAVGPVVLAGGTWAMVTQVVVAPLLYGRTLAPVPAPPSELYGLAPPLLGAAAAGLALLALGGDGGAFGTRGEHGVRGEDDGSHERAGRDEGGVPHHAGHAYVAVAAGFLLVALTAQTSIYDRVLYAGLLGVAVGVAVGRLPRRARVAGVVVVAAVVVQTGALAPLLAGPAVDDPGRSRLERTVATGRDAPCHLYRSLYARAVETRYPSLVRRGGDACADPTPAQVAGVVADLVTGSVPEPDGDWGGGPDPLPSVAGSLPSAAGSSSRTAAGSLPSAAGSSSRTVAGSMAPVAA